MIPNIFKSSQKRCEWIFGEPMKPCPKCGSYNLKYQTPIKLNEELPKNFDAKKTIGVWARTIKDGHTPLEGKAYLMCFDCFFRGPSMDVSGRTAEEVGKDPLVAKKIKCLWNNQTKEQVA